MAALCESIVTICIGERFVYIQYLRSNCSGLLAWIESLWLYKCCDLLPQKIWRYLAPKVCLCLMKWSSKSWRTHLNKPISPCLMLLSCWDVDTCTFCNRQRGDCSVLDTINTLGGDPDVFETLSTIEGNWGGVTS